MALTFLICSSFGTAQRIAAADREAIHPIATAEPGAHDFDLRSVGFDLRHAAKTDPLLAQFQRQLIVNRADDVLHWGNSIALLSPHDARYYRSAFSLAQAGDQAGMDEALSQTDDALLRGTVRATYLLAKDSKPGFAELTDWLQSYRDLPQAAAIYSLAQSRRPKGAKMPPAPQAGAVVHGSLDENGRNLTAQIVSLDSVGDDAVRGQLQTINSLLRQGAVNEAETLYAPLAADNLPPQVQAEAQAAFAALRFFAGNGEAAQKMSTALATQAPLAGWVGGLQAWRDGAYGRAADLFGAMVKQSNVGDADRAAGYYWLGRAQQKLGNATAAKTAWREGAAFPRCFYGQLARAKLGSGSAYNWNNPRLTPDGLDQIAAVPAGKRGLALLQLGMSDAAEQELRRTLSARQSSEARNLAALALDAKLPMLALQLGSWVKQPDGQLLDSALYPLPSWQAAVANSDAALVYAVVRHESGFNPNVVSAAGARGLMQLMPDTARHVDAGAETARLGEIDYNLALGVRYLDNLAQHPFVKRSLLLQIAAYNSGPGNLQRWQAAATHGDDPLLFIETLPVRETRHYVQNVLSSYWMYQQRLGLKPTSLQQLAAGQWPQNAARLAAAPAGNALQLASK